MICSTMDERGGKPGVKVVGRVAEQIGGRGRKFMRCQSASRGWRLQCGDDGLAPQTAFDRNVRPIQSQRKHAIAGVRRRK